MAEFSLAAEAAVRAAGRYLRENLSTRAKASYKGDVDLVTEFDTGAQDILVSRLSAEFPGHGFLAEEGLARPGESGYRWILDPLDGTTNYAHTFPVFCVSAALEHHGKTILGFVFDPMRDEMFSAASGRGAFLNGRPVRVSETASLGESLLATGFPYDVRTNPDNNLTQWARFLVRAQAIRRCGSAALDLCYVACGRYDGFWELKLNPWDVAAGALIVVEAGGRVTDFSGREHRLEMPEALATNGPLHDAMMEILRIPWQSVGEGRAHD